MGRTIELNESSYDYLIQILQDRYYSIVDVEELQKINKIYQMLGYKAEIWLSMVNPKKNNKEDN